MKAFSFYLFNRSCGLIICSVFDCLVEISLHTSFLCHVVSILQYIGKGIYFLDHASVKFAFHSLHVTYGSTSLLFNSD